jgi:hypothetical protein
MERMMFKLEKYLRFRLIEFWCGMNAKKLDIIAKVGLYNFGLNPLQEHYEWHLKQWLRWDYLKDGTDIKVKDCFVGDSWPLVLNRADMINPRFFNRI